MQLDGIVIFFEKKSGHGKFLKRFFVEQKRVFIAVIQKYRLCLKKIVFSYM